MKEVKNEQSDEIQRVFIKSRHNAETDQFKVKFTT